MSSKAKRFRLTPAIFPLILFLFLFSSLFSVTGMAGTAPSLAEGADSPGLAKVAAVAENDQSQSVVKANSEDKSTPGHKLNDQQPSSQTKKKSAASRKTYKQQAASSKQAPGSVRNKKRIKPESAVEPCETCPSILVVGDSLAVGVGMTLKSAFESRCKVRVKAMGKVSSGLDSPAFYDWQHVLKQVLDTEKFDLVVLMMGANDSHNSSGSQAWGQSFESKFAELLKIPAIKHTMTLVVSLPPMREPHFNERVKVANEAIRNASQLFPEDCVYVDAFRLFSGTDGLFTDRISANGGWKKIRGGDGVHFTGEGYLLLSNMVADTALNHGICQKSNF